VGKFIAIISFVFGIPIFLIGTLILGGLLVAGIIGAPNITPAIILVSILLLTGSFLIFLGYKNIYKKRKIVSANKYGEKYEIIKEPAKKGSILVKGLIIVVAIVSVAGAVSGAFIIAPFWNELSLDTVTTTMSPTDNGEPRTIMPSSTGENSIIMEGNDFQPEAATVSLNDSVVWINNDPRAHTATAGTGSSDPNSGKIFDTGIINDGGKSVPIQLEGVDVGDEITYYCMVHPSMTGKLIIDV
jgi:plastocyanin